MEKHYLIYYKGYDDNHGGHASVHFVRADTPAQAVLYYLQTQCGEFLANKDGSVKDGEILYPHPLAYVEANYKKYGEWQIRELPSGSLKQSVAEVFCGESSDGSTFAIAACRREYVKAFPKSRARAFVWYLQRGNSPVTLVTFYRQAKPFRIEIIKRYLWFWDGNVEQVVEWTGDYEQLMNEMFISAIYELEP